MIRSLLIGLVGGLRGITPLAAVSDAARRGVLTEENGVAPYLGHPLVTAGVGALALGELAGDKMKTAPNRTVPAGLVARSITGAICGAALAPRERWKAGAALGAAGAIGAAYVGLALRLRAMARYGQTPTGLVEDAITVAGAWAVVNAGRERA